MYGKKRWPAGCLRIHVPYSHFTSHDYTYIYYLWSLDGLYTVSDRFRPFKLHMKRRSGSNSSKMTFWLMGLKLFLSRPTFNFLHCLWALKLPLLEMGLLRGPPRHRELKNMQMICLLLLCYDRAGEWPGTLSWMHDEWRVAWWNENSGAM